MKKIMFTAALCFITSIVLLAQNVGIGISNPAYKVDVVGTLHTSGAVYVGDFLGVGTTNPSYKLQVNDGAIAIYNSNDLKYWYLNYSSGSNSFQILENGTNRVTIANGGNVGIGNATPIYKLDVAGSINSTGSGYFDGNLTIKNGFGVAYDPTSATNLKVYPFTTATFYAILPGFGLSAEGAIAFGGGFTSTPRVFVGDIDVTGGSAGELYRVQLILYGCNANSCKARLLNTSPNPVNYSITWNCVAIGN